MTRRRPLLLLAALLFAVTAMWLWWVNPTTADMAAYAPANAVLYLEANRPSEIVETVEGTEAWGAFEKAMGTPHSAAKGHWLQAFVRRTGIGPVQSVVLSRAQVAVVVTDIGTTESGDTLKVTAEAAILIETHTTQARIKPLFEETLKTFAEKTYGRPALRRVTINGIEYVEWIAPENSRQIVGTVMGSLAIIGTSEKVVQECIAVSQGQRPALKDDPELKRLRLQLAADRALTFGFVPGDQSARLLAVGIPLLMGRAPDSDFQRLITTGAAKVFGSLGWSSRAYLTGIEDHYQITLKPDALAHLKPSFRPSALASELERVIPNDVYSVTSYQFADPAETWLSLKTAVSSQVDALSSVIFSSLLRSSLLSYGIDEPEAFLKTLNGEVLTLRLDEETDRSLLVAKVSDRSSLYTMLARNMSRQPGQQGRAEEIFEDDSGELAASVGRDFVAIGAPAEVRRYLESGGPGSTKLDPKQLNRIRFFSMSGSTNVVTYTNDESRVRNFFMTLLAAREATVPPSMGLDNAFAVLPYSVTQTRLGDRGLDRTTRSPLGQFSSLLPLLLPAQSGATKPAKEPK